MTPSLLADAFGHHVWATLRLLDTCTELDERQLAASVPGTYGSILDTLRHLVASDASYLAVVTQGGTAPIDASEMDVAALRAAMVERAPRWRSFIAGNLDPEAILVRHRPDGSESHAPLGIRLAQALHHGSDHRSQVCTALTTLGLEPPAIDVWDFGVQEGRVVNVPAPA